MKNFITSLLLATIATVATAVPWTMETLQEHVYKTNINLNGNCSGTVIDVEERLILTAHHCVSRSISDKGNKPVTINIDVLNEKGSKEFSMEAKANIKIFDETSDLAIVQVSVDSMPFFTEATIAAKAPKLGEDVWVVGNPLGIRHSVTKGIVSAPYKGTPFIQTDAVINGGNSGGGVYDSKGELVGVVSHGYAARVNPFLPPIPYGYNFFSSTSAVNAIVNTYNIMYN